MDPVPHCGKTPRTDAAVLVIQPPTLGRVEAVFRVPGHPSLRLWVEYGDTTATPTAGAIADAFFLAALPAAMRVGLPMEVRGSCSPSLVAGAGEWQVAMAALFPEILRRVPVHLVMPPQESTEVSPPQLPPSDGCLICFSGGVDSTFTARVFSGPDNPSGIPLAAGLFMLGFDIEKNNHAGFAAAAERIRPILTAAGARMLIARSNIRDLCHKFGLDWGRHVHGIHLAAVLHLFRDSFTAGVIPSTYPVHDPKPRWGSQPGLDSCLGSAVFPVLHHGAPWNKLGKVRGIAAWDAAERHLRVCWEGPDPAANCGICFKCIATQLCYLASGREIPPAFPRAFAPGEVRALRLRDGQNLRVAEHILAEIAEVGAGAWWRDEWEECVREGRRRLEPGSLGEPEHLSLGRAWLEDFADAVRRRDFARGTSLCHPDIRAFGTIAEDVSGVADLCSTQWEFLWTRTKGFHFLPESIRCLTSGDGQSMVLTARWQSLGKDGQGKEFLRTGRATIVLAHQPDGGYLAAHTHFSPTPGPAEAAAFS